MCIRDRDLNNVLKKIRNKELDGINVTLPYKQKIIPFVDKVVNDALHTNSVNTIFSSNKRIAINHVKLTFI